MAQPIKKNRKPQKKEIMIEGLDYCDDCPFFTPGYCQVNDIEFDRIEKVPVPPQCGNAKKKEKPGV